MRNISVQTKGQCKVSESSIQFINYLASVRATYTDTTLARRQVREKTSHNPVSFHLRHFILHIHLSMLLFLYL